MVRLSKARESTGASRKAKGSPRRMASGINEICSVLSSQKWTPMKGWSALSTPTMIVPRSSPKKIERNEGLRKTPSTSRATPPSPKALRSPAGTKRCGISRRVPQTQIAITAIITTQKDDAKGE